MSEAESGTYQQTGASDERTEEDCRKIPLGASASLRVATRVGEYLIERELGSGGMGSVYLARDAVDHLVAIKFVHTPIATHARSEASHLAQVESDYVARVYRWLPPPDNAFVMEYVPGEPLTRLLGLNQPLARTHALRLAGDICRGLAAIHAVGLVHCDVKPANVIVRDGGRAKLIDLSLARASRRCSGGTPAYMAPEQLHGRVTESTDLFALGVVLFEMLVGQHPFERDSEIKTRKAIETDDPLLCREVTSIPWDLRIILRNLLQKEPSKRFASATLAVTAMDHLVREHGPALDVLPAISDPVDLLLNYDGTPRPNLRRRIPGVSPAARRLRDRVRAFRREKCSPSTLHGGEALRRPSPINIEAHICVACDLPGEIWYREQRDPPHELHDRIVTRIHTWAFRFFCPNCCLRVDDVEELRELGIVTETRTLFDEQKLFE